MNKNVKAPNIASNAILNAFRYILKIILPLITFPYVTRVLHPENYGKVTYCASIISYFALIASLGVNEYAVREGAAYRNDREKISKFASQIFSIQICSTLCSYILLIIMLLIWNEECDYKQIIVIQSIGILLTTMGVEWLYTIYEDFKYITIRSFIVQIISICAIYLLIKSTNDYKVYAAISTGAAGAGYLFNFFHSKKYINLRFTMEMEIKKHIKPIVILFCNVALISIYLNSDKTILGMLKGNESVGLYEVSVKIYSMVKGVLNAVVLVALPRLSAYLSEERYDDYVSLANKSLSAQLIVMFPAITGLFMISRDVVGLMAGSEYLGAVSSLRILSIAMIFAVFANFYVYVIMMSQKMDKQILMATVLSAVLNIGLNFVIIPFMDLNGAALTTLLAEFVVATIGFWFCHIKVPVHIPFRLVSCTAIGCVEIVLVCKLFESVFDSMFFNVAIKIVVSAILYGVTQLFFNRKYMTSLLKKTINM